MFRRNQLFAIAAAGTLSLLALAGCGPKTTTLEATAPANSAETSAAVPMGSAGLGEMTKLIATTKTDVEAGNFDAAKTDGKQIEDTWKQVEDTVKDTDKTAYDAIETHLDGLNSGLKESSPDAAMLTTHLNELESAIGSVTQ